MNFALWYKQQTVSEVNKYFNMDIPLPINATKEEVSTALKFYASATANMSKDLLEGTGSIIADLPTLANIISQLISLASNVQQLCPNDTSTAPASVNSKIDEAAHRIVCHLLSLIGAANDLNSSGVFEEYDELLDDVDDNARGILEACRDLD